MPKVQEQGNSMPSSLHYALTNSQCSKCEAQLEWKAEFNDINSPKYTAKHCNQDYLITIDSVKVEMVNQSTRQETKEKTMEGFNLNFSVMIQAQSGGRSDNTRKLRRISTRREPSRIIMIL